MHAYKTIAVHLVDEKRAEETLAVASRLAYEHDAHLVGVAVGMPEPVSAPLHMEFAFASAKKTEIQRRSEAMRTLFENCAPGLGLRKEWRYVEASRSKAIEALLGTMRCADLIVAGQEDEQRADDLLLECPEELMLGSGRPVLLVPKFGTYPEISSRILLAWNDRKEVARAAFDALPMLQRAKSVRVLWINPDKDASGRVDIPTGEIVKVLSRHGVPCTAATTYGRDIDVGSMILNDITDNGATMLVMGGYGHRRLREYIFGGATRQVFKSMTVPVLMSH